MALHVHLDDGIPLRLGHVDHHPVAQDARVVDQHVQVAERFDGLVDHALRALPVGDAVAVGDCLATHGLDLRHNLACGALVGARAVGGAAEVVDHDFRPFRCHQQGMLAADAPAGASDQDDTSVKCTHVVLPSR